MAVTSAVCATLMTQRYKGSPILSRRNLASLSAEPLARVIVGGRSRLTHRVTPGHGACIDLASYSTRPLLSPDTAFQSIHMRSNRSAGVPCTLMTIRSRCDCNCGRVRSTPTITLNFSTRATTSRLSFVYLQTVPPLMNQSRRALPGVYRIPLVVNALYRFVERDR